MYHFEFCELASAAPAGGLMPLFCGVFCRSTYPSSCVDRILLMNAIMRLGVVPSLEFAVRLLEMLPWFICLASSDRFSWVVSPRNIRWLPRMNRFHPIVARPIVGSTFTVYGTISIFSCSPGVAYGRSCMSHGHTDLSKLSVKPFSMKYLMRLRLTVSVLSECLMRSRSESFICYVNWLIMFCFNMSRVRFSSFAASSSFPWM